VAAAAAAAAGNFFLRNLKYDDTIWKRGTPQLPNGFEGR